MKLKVALCSNAPEYRDYMQSFGLDVTIVPMEKNDDEESIRKLAGFSATAAMAESYSARVLEALKDNLRIVVRHGVGYNRLDVDAATKLGVCCCNTPGAMSAGVAETTLAMMLELCHRYFERHYELTQGVWDRGPLTRQLEGTAIGLIGFGNTAQRVAQYLQGFDCRILAYDVQYSEEALLKYNVEKASIEQITSVSDFISIHVPLLPETTKMVNAGFLSAMKPSAFLINTSRGGTVDEAALIKALQDKTIAGAALDVFDAEPTPADNPLLKLDNVFLTPHMATNTFECTRNGFDGVIKTLKEYEAGEIPEFSLNPDYVNHLSF